MAGRRNQHLSFDSVWTHEEQQKEEICRKNAKLLTEAEEQCVHAHGVHTEEAVGDEVGSHYHCLGKKRDQDS